ncbi:MAG: hypothetical protein EOO61_10880 [Hymenobacter sp.]|nr:MAG: hypothetical protein EOO61_10880 [Hymenobacter sp.]
MKKLLLLLVLFIGCVHADEPQIDHTYGPSYLAFSPDGKRLAVAGSDGVKIYESATGRVLETRRGSSFGTFSLAWSRDGKTLAAGTQREFTIKYRTPTQCSSSVYLIADAY